AGVVVMKPAKDGLVPHDSGLTERTGNRRILVQRPMRSTAVYLFKPAGFSRKSYFAIFDRSARSVDRNRRVSLLMDGDKSRTSSRSVSQLQRLKIGRCLAIGKAIS